MEIIISGGAGGQHLYKKGDINFTHEFNKISGENAHLYKEGYFFKVANVTTLINDIELAFFNITGETPDVTIDQDSTIFKTRKLCMTLEEKITYIETVLGQQFEEFVVENNIKDFKSMRGLIEKIYLQIKNLKTEDLIRENIKLRQKLNIASRGGWNNINSNCFNYTKHYYTLDGLAEKDIK